jgi:hypothetical protein
MNTIELIKDVALFGGTVPNERTEEVRDFLDNVEKQLNLDFVSESVQFDADEIIAFLNDCETLDEAKMFVNEYLR